MRFSYLVVFLGLLVSGLNAHADVETAKAFAKKYAVIAKHIDPDFTGFQPEFGRQFFTRELTIKGKQVACASCHTQNPAHEGKHIVTKKTIAPLSPVVNKKRFTDLDKIEKNFTDHCNDILGRDCSAHEKGEYIAYLLTVGFDSKGDVIKK